EVVPADELPDLGLRRFGRGERAFRDALPVRVLEDAARDAAAGLHPAADRHAAAGLLDAAQGELQEQAAPLLRGERSELAAGGRFLTGHRDTSWNELPPMLGDQSAPDVRRAGL